MLRKVRMSDFESPLDKILREARERGEFDNLPGKGKPIQWEDETHVPEDQRMAQRLLKHNGFTPDWIELGNDLDARYRVLQERLARARADRAAGALDQKGWQSIAQEIAGKIRELNKSIIGYNLRTPHESLHKRAYPIDPDLI
jgi:DnaJ family protein C protein 28